MQRGIEVEASAQARPGHAVRDRAPLPLAVSRHDFDKAWPEDVRALFDESAACNLESSAYWYENLYRTMYAGREPVALWVLREGSAAVAALPLRVEGRALGGTLRPLSHPHYTALYTPCLAAGLAPETLAVLLRHLLAHYRPLGQLSFAPMDPGLDSFACLSRALELAGLQRFSFFCFRNWHLRAPASWADYLAGRSANQRSAIRRGSRKLSLQGGRVEIITRVDDLARGMAAYWRVYAASWKQDEPSPGFIDGLAQASGAHGELRLGLAWLGDRPIAAQLWMVGRGHADIYKLAYDEDFKALAPGNAVSAALLQHVIEIDRVQRVDYLIGDDDYKRTWMSDHDERRGLIAFNPRTVRGLAGAARQALADRTRGWRAGAPGSGPNTDEEDLVKLRHLITVPLLALLSATASAQSPANITDGELELVPTFCRDTQGIRYGNATHNPSPRAAHWVSLMGQAFWAMHHYCWAKINLRRLYGPGSDPSQRGERLVAVQADLIYVIKNAPPDFVMLPEIYSTMAEVELLRKNPILASEYVERARKLKPNYAPPYQVWGSYLMSTGKTKEAKDFVQAGLEFNPSAPGLLDLYKKLGGDPSTIVPKIAPPAPAAASDAEDAPDASDAAASAPKPP